VKRLVGYFFQGFLYIAPLGVTAYILHQVFVLVDEPVAQEAMKLIVSGGLIHLREHGERSGPPG